MIKLKQIWTNDKIERNIYIEIKKQESVQHTWPTSVLWAPQSTSMVPHSLSSFENKLNKREKEKSKNTREREFVTLSMYFGECT